jgi:hypothetical protein
LPRIPSHEPCCQKWHSNVDLSLEPYIFLCLV